MDAVAGVDPAGGCSADTVAAEQPAPGGAGLVVAAVAADTRGATDAAASRPRGSLTRTAAGATLVLADTSRRKRGADAGEASGTAGLAAHHAA